MKGTSSKQASPNKNNTSCKKRQSKSKISHGKNYQCGFDLWKFENP